VSKLDEKSRFFKHVQMKKSFFTEESQEINSHKITAIYFLILLSAKLFFGTPKNSFERFFCYLMLHLLVEINFFLITHLFF
jgi:hypothetical protein